MLERLALRNWKLPTQIAVASIISLAIVGGCWTGFIGIPMFKDEALYGETQQRNHRGMLHWLGVGADPDRLFDGSIPVLQAAVENEDADAVAILLVHGADARKIPGHYQRLMERPAFARKIEEAKPKYR